MRQIGLLGKTSKLTLHANIGMHGTCGNVHWQTLHAAGEISKGLTCMPAVHPDTSASIGCHALEAGPSMQEHTLLWQKKLYCSVHAGIV
jgi:hypothetical protein